MIANTSTYAVSSCPPSRGSVTIMDDEESKQYICIIIIVVLTGVYIVCIPVNLKIKTCTIKLLLNITVNKPL